MQKKRLAALWLSLLLALCCSACSPPAPASGASASANAPLRSNSPLVREPQADGAKQLRKGAAALDYSHSDCGYVMAQYQGKAQKAKCRITHPDGKVYTFDLVPGSAMAALPLSGGDGAYTCTLYEQVQGDQYAALLTKQLQVQLADAFAPFLYANQYVSFRRDSRAVAKGSELARGCHDEIEVVGRVYDFTTQHIRYDDARASAVESGQLKQYLPDVDRVLAEGKGICFDYAALLCAMLRSQRIPTRLEIGYAGRAYHAWISVYTQESGWIDGIIQFDGKQWHLMDPTFAAAAKKAGQARTGGGGDYQPLYYY